MLYTKQIVFTAKASQPEPASMPKTTTEVATALTEVTTTTVTPTVTHVASTGNCQSIC